MWNLLSCHHSRIDNDMSELLSMSIYNHIKIAAMTCIYSGTSEQRPPSGTSLLAFVERLALVWRFCVKHPRFDVFLYILIIKSRINKQESDIYNYNCILIKNSVGSNRASCFVSLKRFVMHRQQDVPVVPPN